LGDEIGRGEEKGRRRRRERETDEDEDEKGKGRVSGKSEIWRCAMKLRKSLWGDESGMRITRGARYFSVFNVLTVLIVFGCRGPIYGACLDYDRLPERDKRIK
jgi:hypothetical protein